MRVKTLTAQTSNPRKSQLSRRVKRNELQINPKVIKGVNACRNRDRRSQSPLRIRSVQVEGMKELGKEEVTSNEVPMTIQGSDLDPKVPQPEEDLTGQQSGAERSMESDAEQQSSPDGLATFDQAMLSLLFIFPSPLCRNLLLPPFCCLIRFCKLQVMACPRDFHYHFCVAD